MLCHQQNCISALGFADLRIRASYCWMSLLNWVLELVMLVMNRVDLDVSWDILGYFVALTRFRWCLQ